MGGFQLEKADEDPKLLQEPEGQSEVKSQGETEDIPPLEPETNVPQEPEGQTTAGSQVIEPSQPETDDGYSVSSTPVTYHPSDKKLLQNAINQSQRLILNLGGERFATCAATLMAEDGLLCRMVQKDSPHQPYETASKFAYFLDRDGKHFRTILNYLRNKTGAPSHRTLPNGFRELEELKKARHKKAGHYSDSYCLRGPML